MAVFEETKESADRALMVRLLTTLSERPEATQRDLATTMGVSLGMVVNYMKSCARKGWVRSKQVSPRRWAYFVTPQGFVEKSRMVSGHLMRSMAFFRETRLQLETLFSECQHKGIRKIIAVGSGDISEITLLVSKGFSVSVERASCVEQSLEKKADGFLITDMENPQNVFDQLKNRISEHKIFTLPVLCIVRHHVKNLDDVV